MRYISIYHGIYPASLNAEQTAPRPSTPKLHTAVRIGALFCIAKVFNKYFIVIIYSIVVRTPIVKRIRKLWAW